MNNFLRLCVTAAVIITTILSAGCSTVASSSENANSGRAEVAPLADVHFHISNYAMQGVSLNDFLQEYMAKTSQINTLRPVWRSVIMPLPLQQRWDSFERYQVDLPDKKIVAGPNYYIGPKADLYYYSFIDAMYATEYLKLPSSSREKLDLMITGFNPMDIYAAQHIKRAVLTFPGAFDGIGEFTIHKEVVSDKLAGDTIGYTKAPEAQLPPDVYSSDDKVSLYADSVTRIFNTAAEIGLVALLHNDIYLVEVDNTEKLIKRYPKKSYETALIDLCKRSGKGAKVIWAHTGLGRFVEPQANHLKIVSHILDECPNWYTDISWDLVQDYILKPSGDMPSTDEWRNFLVNYRNRVLWGTDDVIYSRNNFDFKKGTVALGAPISPEQYAADTVRMDEFKRSIQFGTWQMDWSNYVNLFDEARKKVRAWEIANKDVNVWDLTTPLH